MEPKLICPACGLDFRPAPSAAACPDGRPQPACFFCRAADAPVAVPVFWSAPADHADGGAADPCDER